MQCAQEKGEEGGWGVDESVCCNVCVAVCVAVYVAVCVAVYVAVFVVVCCRGERRVGC